MPLKTRTFLFSSLLAATALWGPWVIAVAILGAREEEFWPLSEGWGGWLYFLGAPINGPFAVLVWTERLNWVEGHAVLLILFEGLVWLMGGEAGLDVENSLSPFSFLASLGLLAAGARLGIQNRLWLGGVFLAFGVLQAWSAHQAFQLLS